MSVRNELRVRSGMGFACVTWFYRDHARKPNEKGRVGDNHLVQVNTCWLLLQLANLLQELLVQSLYSSPPRFRPIGNRQRRSSRRHDWISQILFSILPLNLSDLIWILVEEGEEKTRLKILGQKKTSFFFSTFFSSFCTFRAFSIKRDEIRISYI